MIFKSIINFFRKAFGAYHSVANVDDSAATRIVVIVVAIRAVALNKNFAVFVEVKIFSGFYIGFFLFKHSVFAFDFGFAHAVFINTDNSSIAVTVGVVLAISCGAFKSRHTILLYTSTFIERRDFLILLLSKRR